MTGLEMLEALGLMTNEQLALDVQYPEGDCQDPQGCNSVNVGTWFNGDRFIWLSSAYSSDTTSFRIGEDSRFTPDS